MNDDNLKEQDIAQIAAVIPAYQPTTRLPVLVRQLRRSGFTIVVVVDDGSGPEYSAFFEQAVLEGALITRHCENLGKGRALKTAFNMLLLMEKTPLGCVTVNVDGRYRLKDVVACRDAMLENPTALVMGCRDYKAAEMPAAFQRGNAINRMAMKFICGVKVSDTLSGLRGVPAAFMRTLLHVDGERFEFETNMLLHTEREGTPIVEVPIATPPNLQTRPPHFKPYSDSLQVYLIFVKFMATSLVSYGADVLLFTVFTGMLKGRMPFYIVLATILARVVSTLVNYFLASRAVFKSKDNKKETIPKFAALAVAQMLLSALLVSGLHRLLKLPETVIKIVVDAVLFILNFQVQNKLIFKRKKKSS